TAAPAPLHTGEAVAERAAAPAPTAPAPAALRAKGLDDEEPSRLTYTGPDEGGHASVRRSAEAAGAAEAAGGSGTRRERREAARTQAKPQRKAPKSKKRK
ncbi:MAG TPA: hypothetical protein VIW24_01440, partial [Aldersonia sp.]